VSASGDGAPLDVHAVAEAVVDVLAERGLVIYAGPGSSARVLNVQEVARLLGRSTGWVYEHAIELGAIRMGTGPKARIGFDAAAIEQWKRARQRGPAPKSAPAPRRSRRRASGQGANLIPYEPSHRRA
jgi:predicted DNA-binding transcriptional regulator AlpA